MVEVRNSDVKSLMNATKTSSRAHWLIHFCDAVEGVQLMQEEGLVCGSFCPYNILYKFYNDQPYGVIDASNVTQEYEQTFENDSSPPYYQMGYSPRRMWEDWVAIVVSYLEMVFWSHGMHDECHKMVFTGMTGKYALPK